MSSNSREHHWWPVALQAYWTDSRGNVSWIDPGGKIQKKKAKNRKIAKKSHGHSLFRGSDWETNFEKESKLQEIVDGYLLKDIFALEQIKAPDKLLYLLRLLAQYIGRPVSTTKLANEVGLSQKTIERYLELLEKTFVIKKVSPYSLKMSQSLKFKPKY